jgi:hypothetical protein
MDVTALIRENRRAKSEHSYYSKTKQEVERDDPNGKTPQMRRYKASGAGSQARRSTVCGF